MTHLCFCIEILTITIATRLHGVMGHQKICIVNIIFRNIDGKSAIVSEFVMLIGPLTVDKNRR